MQPKLPFRLKPYLHFSKPSSSETKILGFSAILLILFLSAWLNLVYLLQPSSLQELSQKIIKNIFSVKVKYQTIQFYPLSLTIVLKNVQIHNPQNFNSPLLLKAKKISLTLNLLQQSVHTVSIQNAQIYMEFHKGKWNFEQIFQSPSTSHPPSALPKISLTSSYVHLIGISSQLPLKLFVNNIQMDFPTPKTFHLKGNLLDPLNSFASLDFEIYLKKSLLLTLIIHKFSLNNSFKDRLPKVVRVILEDFSASGQADVYLKMDINPTNLATLNIYGFVRCYNMKLQAKKILPKEITHITGLIRFKQNKIFIEQLDGLYQQSTIKIQGTLENFTKTALLLHIQASDLNITKEFVQKFPQKNVQKILSLFQPSGLADLDLILSLHPSTPLPFLQLHANFKNMQAAFVDYPYPLQRIYGTLKLTTTPNLLQPTYLPTPPQGIPGIPPPYLWNLAQPTRLKVKLALKGFQQNSSVKIKGNISETPQKMALHLKFLGENIAINPLLKKSFQRLLPLQYALTTFRPKGIGNLKVSLQIPFSSEKEIEKNISVSVKILPQNFSLHFQGFHLTQISTGSIKITNNEILLQNLSAEYKQSRIYLSGKIKKKNTQLSLKIRKLSINPTLLQKIYPIHPPLAKQLQELQLKGKANINLNLHFTPAIDVSTMGGGICAFYPAFQKVGITNDLEKLQIKAQIFPYETNAQLKALKFQKISGQILFQKKTLAFSPLVALFQNAPLKTVGSIQNITTPNPQMKIKIELFQLPLQPLFQHPSLAKILPQPIPNLLIQGKAKKILLCLQQKKKKFQLLYATIQLGKISLHYKPLQPLTLEHGTIQLSPHHLQAKLQLRWRKTTFHLTLQKNTFTTLELKSNPLYLNPQTLQDILLLAKIFGVSTNIPIAKQIYLQGKIQLQLRALAWLSPPIAWQTANLSPSLWKLLSPQLPFDIQIHLLQLFTQAQKAPFPILWKKGKIYYNSIQQKLTLQNITGEYDGQPITLWGYAEKNLQGKMELTFLIPKIDFQKKERKYLPTKIREAFEKLNISGYIGSQFHLQRNPFTKSILLNGKILLDEFHIKLGKTLENANGEIDFLARFPPQTRPQIEGQIYLKQALYASQPIQNLQSSFALERELSLPNIQFQLYSGIVRGRLSARVYSTPIFFEGEFALNKVHFKKLVQINLPQIPSRKIEGLLQAYIKFHGDTQGSQNLYGKGWIVVENGKLWDLPPLLGILKLFSLQLPQQPAFQHFVIRFKIYNKKFLFPSKGLFFQSPVLSLYGQGTMDFNLHTNLHFSWTLGQSILGLDEVLRFLKDHLLFQIELKGPLNSPHVRFRSLRILSKPFENKP
ncbi:MAG: hypothetical protein D6805_08915 [Planctomycetota bacterium]|nr:MAG: hypothetical protein D6805_08915 [Planctomycetota bacterium]